MSSGERLFTAWFTSSVDWADHAVTDEEFVEHRPEPTAVCGTVIMLAPMESPPGQRCPRCVAFLRAQQTAEVLDEPQPHLNLRPVWLARLLRHDISAVEYRDGAAMNAKRAGRAHSHNRERPNAAGRRSSSGVGPALEPRSCREARQDMRDLAPALGGDLS